MRKTVMYLIYFRPFAILSTCIFKKNFELNILYHFQLSSLKYLDLIK